MKDLTPMNPFDPDEPEVVARLECLAVHAHESFHNHCSYYYILYKPIKMCYIYTDGK